MKHGEIGHNGGPTSGNWIAISREMRNHPIVGMGQPVKPADPSRGSYSKYEAWQDLLMEAKWKPFEIRNKGKMVTLERGQLMAARAWLASRWNWTDKTVRVFLSALENDLMIRTEKGQSEGQLEGQSKAGAKGQRSGHYSNVLTISNYNIYQTVLELMNLSEGQSKVDSRARAGARGRANQGPESNKETNTQTCARIREEAWPEGDFVEVNGTAIYVSLLGKRLKFEYGTIDQWAALGLCKPDTARQIVEAEARGWVADQKWPDTPSRWLQKQIGNWRIHKAVAETRIENEKKRGAPRASPTGKSFAQQRSDADRESLARDVERIRARGPARPLYEQIEEFEDQS